VFPDTRFSDNVPAMRMVRRVGAAVRTDSLGKAIAIVPVSNSPDHQSATTSNVVGAAMLRKPIDFTVVDNPLISSRNRYYA
jgi:hypothetical protein